MLRNMQGISKATTEFIKTPQPERYRLGGKSCHESVVNVVYASTTFGSLNLMLYLMAYALGLMPYAFSHIELMNVIVKHQTPQYLLGE
jgi:hypothetical protein